MMNTPGTSVSSPFQPVYWRPTTPSGSDSSGNRRSSRAANARESSGVSTLIAYSVTPRAASAARLRASSPSWCLHHGHQ
jgi:hypothetical protein